jgi:hypothetical protein
MTKRRGAAEILAGLLIIGVLAAAMGVMIQYSGEEIFDNTVTAKEAIAIASSRSAELVTIIDYNDSPAVVEVLNYGSTPIGVDDILVDAVSVTYTLKSGGLDVTSLESNKIVEIATLTIGSHMVVITNSGNIIEIDLGA